MAKMVPIEDLLLDILEENEHMEKRIYPPTCWSYNGPDGPMDEPVEKPYECYLHTVATKKVGDTLCAYAGAPGTGRVVHRITRIDETGVYGIVIENTIRELEPWEVM